MRKQVPAWKVKKYEEKETAGFIRMSESLMPAFEKTFGKIEVKEDQSEMQTEPQETPKPVETPEPQQIPATATAETPRQAQSNLMKLCGLWKSKDRNGKEYLSGGFTYGLKLMVMANSFKKQSDNGPDYFVYLAPSEKRQQSRPEPEPQQERPNQEEKDEPPF